MADNKHRVTAVVCVALLCACSESMQQGRSGAASPAIETIDIRSGIYTDAQARRGEGVYGEHCASCHLASMLGKEPAPELAGDRFMTRWRGKTVGDLYSRIMTTMPVNSPGALSPEEYADLVALTLQANNFPAGVQELRPDREYMSGIAIE